MKEILFATGNASKVARFYEKLLEKGILLKSLKDIDISLEIEENGKTAIENAKIKAKAYYEATKMITMAMDDTMYNFEDLSLNKENTKDTLIKEIYNDESGGYQIKRLSEFNMGLIYRCIGKTSKKVIDIEIPAIECKELYKSLLNRTSFYNNN